ncbi:ABC transporter ATP-binding protein [Methylobacterium sp. NFXW15]|uniref:ABC transporter ATP-binding protein n=1 Tax=Methylobacterium sp. NFXW15 TaxID=2819512 RepID=UPI003CFAB86B
MSYLVLSGLRKAYGTVQVLQSLDIAVEKGEFISLLGPSGCGKTTTLQMIAGFIEPSGGAVTLDGADLLKLAPNRRGLGIVFQSYALFPHMSAAQNVAFGLEMRGVARKEVRQRVAEALTLVGLADKGERFPRQMSGGQQQRVALARALVIRPSILLLDEPLSNLDAKMREEMQIELRQIQRTLGTTTILVTHDQQEALALSDRIVVMNAGRIEQVGAPLDVYERPATPFVASFLGTTNVFRGTGRGAAIEIAGHLVPVGRAVSGPTELTVRPEKIHFAGPGAPGLPGRVKARVFQGGHWLFEVETAAGRTVVVRQNDGAPVPAEGEAVVLGFEGAHAQLREQERAA